MSAYLRPGVYVQETLNPVLTTAGPSSTTVAAFVGANDIGPVTATLVTSWSQYVTLYGSWNTTASNDLPIAVYLFFSNGGRQAYVLRMVTTGDSTPSNNAAYATRSLTDRAGSPNNTLSITAKTPGTWGNNLNVTVTNSAISGYFNLTVYLNGTGDSAIVERFTDMSMASTDARYAPSVIAAGSAYITAADLGSPSTGITDLPSLSVVNYYLAGGLNGITPSAATIQSAFVTTGASPFDAVTQSLLINVPNYTDASTVNAVIAYCESRGDAFAVIDPVSGTAATQISTAAGYTASSYAAVYYPQVTISDPTVGAGAARGSTKTVAPGGAIIGQIASTDASRGVFKAPAGLQTRLGGVVSVASLTNYDLDSLNTAGVPVNAIKFVSGSGIVVMGARTLKSSYVDRYIPVRRTLIFLRKSITDISQFAIFEPNDAALWRRINATISSFLTTFWAQGGLVGNTPSEAYYVKVDSTNNTNSSIDNGEVHIEVGVALQRPAEYVVIKIGQVNGNTTVTVA